MADVRCALVMNGSPQRRQVNSSSVRPQMVRVVAVSSIEMQPVGQIA